MGVRVVTPPSFEPVTLDEAKLWCRVEDDATDEEAVLLLLIIAMREYAEHLTGRSFVQRTLELRLDEFPDDEIVALPHGPVQSVTSVSYLDTNGALQTMSGSPTQWQESLYGSPPRIAPLAGTFWADTLIDGIDAVRVQYVVGYPTITAVPKAVRIWMQARIATLFENREQIIVGNVMKIPRDFVDGLLDNLSERNGFA